MTTINPVFRARDIPVDADLNKVITTLGEAYSGFPVHRDLCAIVPSPYTTIYKSALIQFFRPPPALARLGTPKQRDILVLDFGRPNMTTLTLDKDFYELTQLYEPKPLPITADIVAVSGLNGHAYGSWRSKGGEKMWLRDFLSKDLPSCRTMVFGCNTKLSDNSDHEISDYAATLLGELVKARRTTEEKARPIVFVGHSFGGVIIAQAIVKARADTEGICEWKDIFDSTSGIAFFGTPHQGLNLDNLQGMLKEGSPKKRLLDALKPGSSQLKEELPKFVECCDNIKIITFYEVKPTNEVVTSPEGVSTASGDPRVRVDRDSTILKLPSDTEQAYVADGDHFDMIKFKHNLERSYLTFLDFFRKLDLSPRNATPAPATPAPGPAPTYPIQPIPPPSAPSQPPPPVRNNEEGGQALINASSQGDVGTVQMLLGAGVSPEWLSPDGSGIRALHAAAIGGHVPIVRLLLQYGAAIDAVEAQGRNALHLAAISNRPDVVRELIQAHIARCISLDIPDRSEYSALHYAAAMGHQAVVEALLQSGAAVGLRAPDGSAPLALAAGAGHRGVISILLARGAEVNAVDNRGMTPLSLASKHGQVGAVEELLGREALIEPVDAYNNSAIDYANAGGHRRVVEILSIVRQQRIARLAQRAPGLQAQAGASILGFGLSFGAQSTYWP